MKKTLLAAAFLMVGAAGWANAGILDIRGGVGLTSADAKTFDDRAKAANAGGVDSNSFDTYNADIFINLPAVPIGFGVREEWLNASPGGGSDVKVKGRNLALLVDLRLIDSKVFYLGPIASVGQATSKIDFKNNGEKFSDRVDSKNLTWSGGLEAGVYISHFLIGAEAGYQNIKFKDTDTSSNVNGTINADGFYGKAMVGLTFF